MNQHKSLYLNWFVLREIEFESHVIIHTPLETICTFLKMFSGFSHYVFSKDYQNYINTSIQKYGSVRSNQIIDYIIVTYLSIYVERRKQII